jgi:AraC-like DNA-binding protein
LRFVLEGTAELEFATGERFETPSSCLVGPSTGAMHFTINGPFRMWGIGLLPAGWAMATRQSAALYTDRVVAAHDVFSGEIDNILPVLKGLDRPEAMVEWTDQVLRSMRSRLNPEILSFTRMVDDWLAADPDPVVAELMAKSALGPRQTLRQINRLYGMPPKMLARKYRALRAARALADGNADELVNLIDSFYDQSHMIREIKHFAGTTPSRLRVEEGQLACLIDQRQELKGLIARLTADT